MRRFAALVAAVAATTSFDASAFDMNPIQHVTRLLEDMRSGLEKEVTQDADVYEKVGCFCDSNISEKQGAIDGADAETTRLLAEIQDRSAGEGRLSAEIKDNDRRVAEAEAALKRAEAIRRKERDSFSDEDKALMEAVTQLKNAVAILRRNHELVQTDSRVRESVLSVIAHASTQHDMMRLRLAAGGKTVASPTAKAAKAGLLQTGQGSGVERMMFAALTHPEAARSQLAPTYADQVLVNMLQQESPPAHLQEFAPQSGQIVGVLQSMLDSFTQNMSAAQKGEAEAQRSFAALRAAKQAEIKAAEALAAQRRADRANNGKALADAKGALESTRGVRAADVQLLQELKLRCGESDHEFSQRQQARNEEIVAVNDALEVLRDDDTREHLMRTTFVQLGASADTASSASATARARARALRAIDDGFAALASQFDQLRQGGASTRLSQLKVSVKLDSFASLQAQIARMVEELQKQQADEVVHRDWCIDEINLNEKTRQEKSRHAALTRGDIDQQVELVAKLGGEIETAQNEIAETKSEIKLAGETREAENAGFQQVVNDQRATQVILAKVRARLAQVYAKSKKGSLLSSRVVAAFSLSQTDKKTGQAPPAFDSYKKQFSNPVMAILQKIVADSGALEHEAVHAEQEQQKAYERFVHDANATVAALSKAVTGHSENKASVEADHVASQADLNATNTELEQLGAYKDDLHSSCDFVMRNFDIRQGAREAEMQSLKQVKAILAGSVEG